MKRLAVITALCLAGTIAHARDADGRLGLVRAPNSTQPAIVVRGGTFDVTLREDATLRLESAAGAFALSATEVKISHGARVATVPLPADVPAGTYTLAGTSAAGEDRNFRSVLVLDAPLETYRIAVWSNLRVGADPQRPDTELYRGSAQINSGEAALVLVTGDLTVGGTPEQFRLALDILNDCNVPTLVAPGDVDFASGRVTDFLGTYPAAVPFGLDGILLCSAPHATLGAEAGRLHLERRRIRAARWSIGAVPVLDFGKLRDQLTVLADDPLNALLGVTAEGADSGKSSPWGHTDIFTVPPDRAVLQWYSVTSQPISAVRDR